MKNLLLSTLFIFGTTLILTAQGFYVQPGISYLSPATNDVVGVKADNALNSEQIVDGVILGSYGSGFGLDLGLGYMFSRNFGFDLGISYVLGKETLIEEFADGDSFYRSYATNKRLTISPAFIIDAGSETLSPFARFGLLVPVAGQTNGLGTSNEPALVSSIIPALYPTATGFEAESIAKGQFSLGFTGAVGLRYQLNEMISISGSIGYTGLRINRDTYEVSRAELDLPEGKEDVLALLSLGGAYPYTQYYDEVDAQELATYITDSGDNYGTKESPAWAVTEGASFSTFNISLGARFSF